MKEKTKVKKVTRGYNLSEENVRWLQRRSFELTMKGQGGKVSDSAVLDEIVTEKRLKSASPSPQPSPAGRGGDR